MSCRETNKYLYSTGQSRSTSVLSDFQSRKCLHLYFWMELFLYQQIMIKYNAMCSGCRAGVHRVADEGWEDPGGKRETPQQSGGGRVSRLLSHNVAVEMLIMVYGFGSAADQTAVTSLIEKIFRYTHSQMSKDLFQEFTLLSDRQCVLVWIYSVFHLH